MRRSSIEGDAGYLPWCHEHNMGCKHRIFLDEVEQFHVSMADEDEGFIVRCVLDDDGCIQADPSKPDEVWTERIEGEVRIDVEFPAQ